MKQKFYIDKTAAIFFTNCEHIYYSLVNFRIIQKIKNFIEFILSSSRTAKGRQKLKCDVYFH